MDLPQYKPNQWVIFEALKTQYIGLIVGGSIAATGPEKGKWTYSIECGLPSRLSAPESEIIAVLDGEWEVIGSDKKPTFRVTQL
jgi:hypothetical protein